MLSDSVDASFYRSWRCKYRYSECDEEQDNYDTQKSKESKEETKNINDKFHNVANKLPTVKYHSIFNKRGLIFSPQSILSESNLNSVATQFQSNIENMMVNYSYPLVGIRTIERLVEDHSDTYYYSNPYLSKDREYSHKLSSYSHKLSSKESYSSSSEEESSSSSSESDN